MASSNDQNVPPPPTGPTHAGKKRLLHITNPLELGPRKRLTIADPLIGHGRHFGRTVFMFTNMQALLLTGLAMDDNEVPKTQQECREGRVFRRLLKIVPGLQDRLFAEETDGDAIISIATLLQKGASSTRSDDTKSLKGVVIDWISPADGEPLRPSIARNSKLGRGFNHERTGFLLCPPGIDWKDPEIKGQLKKKELLIPGNHWPIFVYWDERYDPEEPWRGLFRSRLLISAYKHVFTSPSSINNNPKATRSGNARIHGMTCVTPVSIAYIATQVRFALSSASVFCRTDKETDSETFYTSVLELFEDPEEQDEVKDLIAWWNRQIFPSFLNVTRVVPAESTLSKIKAKRTALQALNGRGGGSTSR